MRKPSPSRRLVELKTGRKLEDVLRELYVEKGYTFVEIGEALGVNRETVRQWIDQSGMRDERPPATQVVA